MERKNLVLFPAAYYYPQVNVPPPPYMYYYGQQQYQHCTQMHNPGAGSLPQHTYPPQIIPTTMSHIQSQQYGYDINHGEYNIQRGYSTSMQMTETPQQMHQNEMEHNYGNGGIEDDWMGNDQFTLNNSFYSHQNNFKSQINSTHRSNSTALISTSIVIQEGQQNTSFEEEHQWIKQESKKSDQYHSGEQVPLEKEEQQPKRAAASWRFNNCKVNNDSSQHIPIILNANNIQPQTDLSSEQQQMKLQPEVSSDKMRNDNEAQVKICKEEVNESENMVNQQVSNTISHSSESKDHQMNDQDGQMSGNLCKNLMRAFNKFVQNYNFKDISIKVSLFRFLERNTYSNLQMLKIYHNPRYKQIFLEFVKDGALLWLQKSKVIDINAHIILLDKIIQGDVSQIGIKKRKNVSKVITTSIKKKSAPTKKI